MKALLKALIILQFLFLFGCNKENNNAPESAYYKLKIDNEVLLVADGYIMKIYSYGSSGREFKIHISGSIENNTSKTWVSDITLVSDTTIKISDGNYLYSDSIKYDLKFAFYNSSINVSDISPYWMDIDGGSISVTSKLDTTFFDFNVLVDSTKTLTGKFGFLLDN